MSRRAIRTAAPNGICARRRPFTAPKNRQTGAPLIQRHEGSALCLQSSVTTLAPDRFRLQLTVSRETHDTLRRAQALLRHAVPSGDAAEIIGRALTLLVEDLERKRFAATTRPRPSSSAADGTRHIPAAVRRAVWRRDQGRCAFTGASKRCRETGFLEFHHVVPFAAGGRATVENIVLHCRAHNAHEACLFFSSVIIDYANDDKVDAPSGTARELAARLAKVRSPEPTISIDQSIGPREARGATVSSSQIHSVRLPGYVISLEILFGMADQRLLIRHDAGSSARPYVDGALLAIRKVSTLTGVHRGLDAVLDV